MFQNHVVLPVWWENCSWGHCTIDKTICTTAVCASERHCFCNHCCCLYWCLFLTSKATCIFYSHSRQCWIFLLWSCSTTTAEKQILCNSCFCYCLLSITVLKRWHPVGGVQVTGLNSSFKEADKAMSLASPLGWCWKGLRKPEHMTDV